MQVARSIENDNHRSEALAKIAELQAESRNFDAAIEISEIILVERRVHLYNVTRSMLRAGDRE